MFVSLIKVNRVFSRNHIYHFFTPHKNLVFYCSMLKKFKFFYTLTFLYSFLNIHLSRSCLDKLGGLLTFTGNIMDLDLWKKKYICLIKKLLLIKRRKNYTQTRLINNYTSIQPFKFSEAHI